MTLRVYYDHNPRFLVGPLWAYEVGQEIEPKGVPAIVCRVDPDGVAVAWSKAYIQAEAERRSITFDQMADTLKGFSSVPKLMKESELMEKDKTPAMARSLGA